jgi:prepilin-type N-terminal cleavage/methylation domain-containing protein/prepilin-type processing-associated H-X9-DG protein
MRKASKSVQLVGRTFQSAFTLMEMLVVIVVLALLAAIVLPALSSAQKKALQTQCANNLRQLNIALGQFVSDYRGYPFADHVLSPPSGFPEAGWMDAVGSYGNKVQWNTNRKPFQPVGLFHCPAAQPPSSPPWPKGLSYCDYGYNAYGISRVADTSGSLGLSRQLDNSTQFAPFPGVAPYEVNQPVRESQIASPSDMIAIGDGFAGDSQLIIDWTHVLWRRSDLPDVVGSTRRAYARHQAKANIAFCDGHLAAPTLSSLFTDSSDEALSRWNRDHQPHRERLIP